MTFLTVSASLNYNFQLLNSARPPDTVWVFWPCEQSENCHQAEILGDIKAHHLCFPFFRDNSCLPSFSNVRKIIASHIVLVLSCLQWKVRANTYYSIIDENRNPTVKNNVGLGVCMLIWIRNIILQRFTNRYMYKHKFSPHDW